MKINALFKLSDVQIEEKFRQTLMAEKEKGVSFIQGYTQNLDELDASSIRSEKSQLDDSFNNEINVSNFLGNTNIELDNSHSFLNISRSLGTFINEIPPFWRFKKNESEIFENYKKNVYDVL